MAKQKLQIIGTTDCIDFIDVDIENLPCKIDTGAAISAIHADRIRLIEKDGIDYLSFKLLDKKHPNFNNKEILTSDFKEKRIKNSFGEAENRYLVKLKIRVFDKIYNSSFTLTNRKQMTFPVLLGKKFLKGNFIVDVSQQNLSFKSKKITL
ncbi:MAG: ATP-dependent zinc protease [Bacteroidia bacterium]